MSVSPQKGRLTTPEYWETSQGTDHDSNAALRPSDCKQPWWRSSPSAYAVDLHEAFCRKHLPTDAKLRFLEVGASPGRNVVKFHRDFGYDAFGVEYTDLGFKIMRDVLSASQIPPDNAIHADFFDPSFQARYHDSFDIVGSFGFLEHFDQPRDVVKQHLNLLKPGGILLITIPNFRYLNYYLKRFFNTEFIATHNLDLMDISRFRECFILDDFQIVECRPLGSFQFPQPTHTSPWKRVVEQIMGKQQLLLNAVLKGIFASDPPESRYFSKDLVCVGRKGTKAHSL